MPVLLPSAAEEVAVMVAVPAETPVTRPVLLIDATAVLDDIQVTEVVRFCVVVSENVPVAVSCPVNPGATLGLTGVTAIDRSVAEVTVSVVDPTMLPVAGEDVAVMVTVPAETAAARPVLLIDASPTFDDCQVTDVVMFCVELSEKVPVAVNCCVVPLAREGLAGVTAMDTRVAGLTVKVVVPETAPAAVETVAVIVVVPTAVPVASPLLLIVATAVFDERQEADRVRSCVELSEKFPVAVNCCFVPLAMIGSAGVIVTDWSVAAPTVRSNAGSDTVLTPSFTDMTIPDVVPISADVGVPVSAPVPMLNFAHAGLFVMLKSMQSTSLSASITVGTKLYLTPTCAVVDGVPVMNGATSGGGTTVTEIATVPTTPFFVVLMFETATLVMMVFSATTVVVLKEKEFVDVAMAEDMVVTMGPTIVWET